MVHELAMLFCHAGFDVFFALSDSSAKLVSPELAKAVTGNEALTSSTKPAWLKSKHSFDLSIVFNPLSSLKNESLQQLSLTRKSDQLVFLNESSTSSETLPDCDAFYSCPVSPGQISDFFQHLFAREVRRMYGRKRLQSAPFFLSKCLIDSDALDLAELRVSMNAAGFIETSNPDRAKVIFSSQFIPEYSNNGKVQAVYSSKIDLQPSFVACPQGCLYFIARKNFIHTETPDQQRIFPSAGAQKCFDRFADFLANQVYNARQAES